MGAAEETALRKQELLLHRLVSGASGHSIAPLVNRHYDGV